MARAGTTPEVAPAQQLSGADLPAAYPFASRFIRSSLRYAARRDWTLESAERVALAFTGDAWLWTLRFGRPPPDKPSARLRLFEVSGVFFTVHYTDACFYAAAAATRQLPDFTDEQLRDAYLAAYFSTAERWREHQQVFRSFDEMTRPEELPEAEWAEAAEKVQALLSRDPGPDAADSHAYLLLDGRRKRLSLTRFRFADFIPLQLTNLDEPLLEHETLKNACGEDDVRDAAAAWHFDADPKLPKTTHQVREMRLFDAQQAIEVYKDWKPPEFEGDAAEIERRSRALHEKRKDKFGWRDIFPSDDNAARAESGKLLAALENRQPDFTVPDACRDGCFTPTKVHPDCPIKIRRRMMPAYAAHRLYEIVDRRGGRPRATQILFAPDEAGMPEALDSLFPLSGTSNTYHFFNKAYRPVFTDETALEYLAVFCISLSGGEGLFQVIESESDIRWRGSATRQREAIAGIAKPLRLWKKDEEGSYYIDGLLAYAGALFHTYFRVRSSGYVEMLYEHPVIERLDAAPEIFTSKTHFFLRVPKDFHTGAV